jgi:hypothetical protein
VDVKVGRHSERLRYHCRQGDATPASSVC